MKSKFTLFALLLLSVFGASAQQVPNASFDSWTVDTLAPDGWSTYESYFGVDIGLASKDAADFIVGPYSLKIESDSVPGQPVYGAIGGQAGLGDPYLTPQGIAFRGAAFAFRPDTVFIGYKYAPVGADSALFGLGFRKNNASAMVNSFDAVQLKLPAASQWTLVGALLGSFYLNGTIVPDTLRIDFCSSKSKAPNGGSKGSVLKLDAFLFGYAQLPNALQQLADDLSFSVYPNPATDFVTITSKQNASGFRAFVSDINGQMVSVNYLEGETNRIDVSTLATGTYIFRIADAQGNVLKNGRFNVVK